MDRCRGNMIQWEVRCNKHKVTDKVVHARLDSLINKHTEINWTNRHCLSHCLCLLSHIFLASVLKHPALPGQDRSHTHTHTNTPTHTPLMCGKAQESRGNMSICCCDWQHFSQIYPPQPVGSQEEEGGGRRTEEDGGGEGWRERGHPTAESPSWQVNPGPSDRKRAILI